MKSVDQYNKLLLQISKLDFISKLTDRITANKSDISIKHLSGSLPALAIASLWQKQKSNVLVLTSSIQKAENWYHDLSVLVSGENVALLTEPRGNVHSTNETQDDKILQLIDGLSILQQKDFSIAIAMPDIFNIKLPDTNYISSNRTVLSVNQYIDFEDFVMNLMLNGFEKNTFVASQGDLAVRGGIVDIFPIGWDNPIRIEFFGNEIESIREFNSLSQRSIKEYDTIEFLSNVYNSSNTPAESSIINYLNKDYLFVLDSPDIMAVEFPDTELPDGFRKVFINQIGQPDIEVKSESQKSFNGSIRVLGIELRKLGRLATKVFLAAEGKIHLERLQDLVEKSLEYDKPEESLEFSIDNEQVLKNVTWLNETLTEGFALPGRNFAYYTEHQVFDRQRIRDPRKSKKLSGGLTLAELKQLKIGDLVVHTDKGIGRFDGFEKVTLGGVDTDCVRVIYAEGDILYVHLNYLHKIQKYSSQEGVQPTLSKLGSAEWARRKAKTKKRLKDIARELIKLYAERKMQSGFPFPEDTLWQKEFEASFIYEDTPDQEQTTIEVKKDMEEDKPMDRLVCGDVGFGKTEIAIRAAFKAVQAGKQVAVLVPTTILAQQHYLTFKERLHRYPVNIEAVSRFRTKKEQDIIVDKTKNGLIDILIGTHRLLSKDIVFKDLGMLIIDEEHRFGVGAKEKLRQIKANIDTLTLTATPIPRTLNFSLMGARDLSVIETPPRNRLPIYTEILEWNNEKIQQVIKKEIERKGQVFFVTDRVIDIDKIAMNLQMLMPTLHFGVAHGQMATSELEKVMEKFIDGKYDVLVTTKIVESGLDIPNANTIIINRSDHFGLAELYQLRGRVGRSNIQASCYLIIPPLKTLPAKTLQRLYALEEFNELGSGFQLALRDMEIRGTGNLLGAEQSGYINEMGFDFYQKVLEEAVQELRREEFSELFKDDSRVQSQLFQNDDLAIEVDKDALLPAEYINSDTERFRIYKELYNLRDNEGLNSIVAEMQDRFGRLPQKADELIFAVRLRIAALNTGFVKIILKEGKMIAEFPPDTNEEYYKTAFPMILEFLNDMDSTKILQHNKKLLLEVQNIASRDEALEILWRFKRTIQALID